MPSEPRAIVLTPPGRGAVATVRIVGEGAAAIVAERFFARGQRVQREFPLDRILYGRWGDPTGEEVVLCRRPACEEAIDIHCHGGTAAVRVIVQSLVERGAVEATGRESIWWPWASDRARGVACHENDSRPLCIAIEAQGALAQAPTLRTAMILMDQWAGALLREIAQVQQLLAAGEIGPAIERLQALLQRAALGLHLTTPWRVVLAGRPNVGKSSLINALLGYQRSIVFDQPGTTRDVVTATAALDGWPMELTDTAGLRAEAEADQSSADELEAAGIAKALDQITAADLLVLVLDATQPRSAEEDELIRRWPHALVLLNKCDLAGNIPLPLRDGDAAKFSQPLRTSALTGEGIEALGCRIAAGLVPDAPSPGVAVPFTPRQVHALHGALASLRRQAVDAAESHLRLALEGEGPPAP